MGPPRAKTIPALLDELAERYPDQEALVGGGMRLSYRALRGEVRRLAKGLRALGVRRGDKVGILMGNRPEWLLADFAITLLGGTMVAINTWATARELAHVLRHSDTKFPDHRRPLPQVRLPGDPRRARPRGRCAGRRAGDRASSAGRPTTRRGALRACTT